MRAKPKPHITHTHTSHTTCVCMPASLSFSPVSTIGLMLSACRGSRRVREREIGRVIRSPARAIPITDFIFLSKKVVTQPSIVTVALRGIHVWPHQTASCNGEWRRLRATVERVMHMRACVATACTI
jgi:hypothetical protein